jgi:hypothetical protein
MSRANIRFRQRYFCMTRKDEDEFSALLREKMPEVVIFQGVHERRKFVDYPSITDADGDVAIGLRAPDWKPAFKRYRKKTPTGWTYRLRKWPHSYFEFHRAYVGEIDLSKITDDKGVIKPVDFRGRRFTREGEMQGYYKPGDSDKKRFLDKAFRIAANFMTNAFEIYDLKTGKYIETFTKCVTWAGPDVIRLCREEADFVCFVHFRRDLDTWTGYKAIPKP